jgi:histidinol dehydrogenase
MFSTVNTFEKKVAKIIDGVKRDGDSALVRFTREFDRVSMGQSAIRVKKSEIRAALKETGADFADLVREITGNIASYHRKQKAADRLFRNIHGAEVGWLYLPVERAGVYLPGGTAPLVSTALMTIVPARVAGVREIVVATPPRKDGKINPFLLAACHELDADCIVRVGGAQAVAAMAFGTRSVPRVDLIAGPGNKYVTEAKRQLYGKVGIDMAAGPSEVAIVADRTADPSFIAADLLAQAEHVNGMAVLFSPSVKLIADARREFLRQSNLLGRRALSRLTVRFVKCRSLDDAVRRVNRMAPEHLEIMVSDHEGLLSGIRHAGAIFIGAYSPTALGDYVAGPSHVLPTGGTARHSSVLSVDTFLRRVSMVKYGRTSLKIASQSAERLAMLEGLDAHARSIRIRRQKLG